MVELIYIPADSPAIHLRLNVAAGLTVGEVLNQSGLLDTHPEIRGLSVGIFSKTVTYLTKVQIGDRIEIYRPLSLDPMEKRRQRAKKR